MKLKKNSLIIKIWKYLIIFSIFILAFLWLFQIVFLNTFYEKSKTKELNNIVKTINKEYQNNTLINTINDISTNNDICLELVEGSSYIYNNPYNRNCLDKKEAALYKQKFIISGQKTQTYKLINPRFNNRTLVVALKLDNNLYAYSSISLQPLDSTINILKNQLIITTIILLILSFIISFFVSKKLSNPIIKISKMANSLSKVEKTNFEIDEDIDEINELVNTLNDVSIELNKTEELRRELMANVGHDLKTPLTMIKAYAEMVRDLTYKNKEKRDSNLNTIIEETDKLNLLVNDIIELSKLQTNNIELNFEQFDLNELIKETIHRFNYLEELEGYQIIYNNQSNIMIYADKKRLEQVIYNLLNNAINYTGEDKKVYINVSLNNNKYKIEIIDTGKGINKKDINLIWEKYYKVDKNYSRNKIGTGIGLSIVKNILTKHNLEFGVTSKLGNGSNFWFKISKKESK